MSTSTFYDDIPNELFDLAGDMFIHLNNCPEDVLESKLRQGLDDILSHFTVPDIILSLNRISRSSNGEDLKSKTANYLLLKIMDLRKLHFKKLFDMNENISQSYEQSMFIFKCNFILNILNDFTPY